MIIHTPFVLAVTCFAILAQSGSAWAWSNKGGGDHSGNDWAPAANAQISGNHKNIGTFTISAGKTVNVQRYNGSSSIYGRLTINAENIIIAGTLNGVGRGYGGGGGGGGTRGVTGPGSTISYCSWHNSVNANVSEGAAGAGYAGGRNGGKAAFSCSGGGTVTSGAGGSGGGSYGASGGSRRSVVKVGASSGRGGAAGGYNSSGKNTDTTMNSAVSMGSGGGGGSGGASGYTSSQSSVGGSGGGGAGGSGGGQIMLIASNILNVSGLVSSNGANGGGNGSKGSAGSNVPREKCDLEGNGGKGGTAATIGQGLGASGVKGYFVGSAYNSTLKRRCNKSSSSTGRYGAAGGNGGAGAGGGILLNAPTVTVTGTVSNLGGDAVVVNGGTVKVFYCEKVYSASDFLTGRLYEAERSDCAIDIGLRIYEGGRTIRISAEDKTPTKSPIIINRNGRNYGVLLVDTSDAKATETNIRLKNGIVKAFRDLD